MAFKMSPGASFIAVLLVAVTPQITTPQTRTDQRPEVQRIIGLSYPRIANLAGIEGTVKLIARISPDGKVDSVRVVSGSVYLSEAAKQSLLGWHFLCLNVGKPCEATVSFIFKLDEICDRQSCPSEFKIDLPNEVTVRAKRIRAIID